MGIDGEHEKIPFQDIKPLDELAGLGMDDEDEVIPIQELDQPDVDDFLNLNPYIRIVPVDRNTEERSPNFRRTFARGDAS